jgi:hypothetical protein
MGAPCALLTAAFSTFSEFREGQQLLSQPAGLGRLPALKQIDRVAAQ